MKKYHYKGTVEQLIEYGFKKEYSDFEIYTRVSPGCERHSEIVIFFNEHSVYPLKIFLFNFERYERNNIIPHIKDLIDAGLVEVRE